MRSRPLGRPASPRRRRAPLARGPAPPSRPADLRPRARRPPDDMILRGVSVDEGNLADLDAVMRVMNDSFDGRFGEAWTAPQCAGLLPMPGVWLSLARDDQAVIGFALARVMGDEAELLLLAVGRSSQRRGVGQMLLDRFAAVAASKGRS